MTRDELIFKLQRMPENDEVIVLDYIGRPHVIEDVEYTEPNRENDGEIEIRTSLY